MDENTQNLKASWRERQAALGSTRRSVLYKNFPDFLNNSLHKRHVRFILRYLPENAAHVLDLGCGYGRIAAELKREYPALSIQGVELCDEFAEQFRRDVGDCAVATLQDYEPTRSFDAILCVTVLMYVSPGDLDYQLGRYWQALAPGGRLICIESRNNSLVSLRRASASNALSPTGGELAHYFQPGELASALARLPHSRILRREKFGVLPLINAPALHEGFVAEKLPAG